MNPQQSPGWANRLKQGLSFILQMPCALCDRPSGQVFCQDCSRRLSACRRSSSILQVAELPPLYSWGHYEGALKQGLSRLKYDRRDRVAEPFGQWLAQLWLDAGPLENRHPVVVPIPLHTERQQQRGYNQAERIAYHFCQVIGMPLRSQGLARIQSTDAQYGLSRAERYRNLRNAFRVGIDLQKHPNPTRIILVDDIFTTGATLKSATETLHQGGFQVVALLTVAISERRTR